MFVQLVKDTPADVASYDDESTGSALAALGPIGNINAFVGANNSGKSRLLRALACMKRYTLHRDEATVSACRNLRSALNDFAPVAKSKGPLLTYSAFRDKHQADPLPISLLTQQAHLRGAQTVEFDESYFIRTREVLDRLVVSDFTTRRDAEFLEGDYLFSLAWLVSNAVKIAASPDPSSGIQVARINVNIDPTLADVCGRFWRHYESIRKTLSSQLIEPKQRIYIPTLRGAVLLEPPRPDRQSADRYADVVKKNYGLAEEVEVFTGQRLYDVVGIHRNGARPIRERFRAFERFLGQNFFGQETVEVVAHESDKPEERHIKITAGAVERNLHDLGDGVNALLILTYRLFTADPGTWFFIEEPETHLHPGLQRLFLETLVGNEDVVKKGFKIFLTTHSNHFLDLALRHPDDVSVLAFQKVKNESEERFAVRIAQSSRTRVLDDLGVANASVFLANCTIWVEGPSDRIYVRAYLKAYADHLRAQKKPVIPLHEDFNFSFFEYAGSNLSHYYFSEDVSASKERIRAQFLSNRILVISDADTGKEEKHETLWGWQGEWFSYLVTPSIEVENLVSPALLKLVLPKFSAQIDAAALVAFPDDAEYLGVRLGEFLLRNVAGFPKAARAEGGTLSTYYKLKLANLVAENCTWENMSSGAQHLAKAVYEFIERQNLAARGSFI